MGASASNNESPRILVHHGPFLCAWRLLAIPLLIVLRHTAAGRHRRPALGLGKRLLKLMSGYRGCIPEPIAKVKGEVTSTELGQTLEQGQNSAPGAGETKPMSSRNKNLGVEGAGCSPAPHLHCPHYGFKVPGTPLHQFLLSSPLGQ